MNKQDLIQKLKSKKELCHQPFYHEKLEEFQNRKDEVLERRIKLSNSIFDDKRILEVGCNLGTNSFILSESHPTSRIFAFDIIEDVVDIAENKEFFKYRKCSFFCKEFYRIR